MKDPKTLSGIIRELSKLTGKEVSQEKEDKIINLIVNDKVPTNIFSKFAYYVLEWGKTSYIKRVIGLPGEHVQIMDGKVYIQM